MLLYAINLNVRFQDTEKVTSTTEMAQYCHAA